MPIIANGNIRDLKDVDECLRYTGAAAIMSAQSLLNDPMALQVPEESPDSPDRLILAMQRYLDLVAPPLVRAAAQCQWQGPPVHTIGEYGDQNR